jgi:hypothetical protein
VAATDDMRDLLADAGVEATGDMVIGVPVDELLELSRRVELLVLGSRAWGPVRRILVGSTAARALGGAPSSTPTSPHCCRPAVLKLKKNAKQARQARPRRRPR